MAVKKTQMYRKNLDTSETNLYPLTEAQYVSMENGQTVQEILSDRDSDKYTPVITNSSSTFKVGQGDNVDLSSSMKEGAYDSCVLKGKTMVNCIQEPSSQDVVLPYEFADGQYVTINDTKESGALGVELKGQTLVNTLVYEHTALLAGAERNGNTFTLNKSQQWSRIHLLKSNPLWIPNETYTTILYDVVGDVSTLHMCSQGGAVVKTPFNNNRAVFTMGVGRDSDNRCAYIESSTIVADQKVSFKVVVLKGDYSDIDVPFFTGMTSCKMPTLSTVGKNLFDGKFELGNISMDTGAEVAYNGAVRTTYIKVKPNTTYCISRSVETTVGVRTYDKNKKFVKSISLNSNNATTFTTPNEVEYIRFALIYANNDTTVQAQLEEGSNATSYETHKSSILSLPEEVVLRSLPNGVCDTFNTRTGVYTQRIGEVVLNGSEGDWVSINAFNKTNVFRKPFSLAKNEVTDYETTVENFMTDKLPVVKYRTYDVTNAQTVSFSSLFNSTYNDTAIYINKNSSSNLSEFKTWLSQNPVTVQYELKTPIVTKINLSSTLKSWNTTTHVYSEIPENTLYPTLSHSNPSYPVILKPSTKYSIVANSYSNSHTNSTINFNLGGATASTVVGNRVTTVTTPSTLSNELLTMSGRGNKLNNVMVIEGDVMGDEPYFEGICDCKSPILSNVGGNLLPTELSRSFKHITGNQVVSSIDLTSFLNRGVQYVIKLAIPKNVKIAKHYSSNSADDESVLVSHGAINSNNTIARFTIPSNSNSYYLFVNESGQSSSDYISDISELVTIELDTGNIPTEIKPYKSNITTFDQKDDKTIVLRSLPNGVCDTLNVETGEYVQRIGEYRVTGGEEETYGTDGEAQYIYISNTSALMRMKNTSVLVCDKFPYNKSYSTYNYPKVSSTSVLIFVLPTSATGLSTKAEREAYIKNLAKTEGITVQYELATPIISTIDVQGFPHAYTNGHVQLSSGAIEQSLTPKVEYSLSANKTGQINSNTKRVSAHQKQLDDFEAMMLTQMVQSAYDKAILQFDYEMQMMSLGGE